MKRIILILAMVALLFPLSAQQNGDAAQGFSAGLNLGSDLLPNPDTGVLESWSKLGFQPDLAIGKFGVGLDLTFRFKLYPDGNTPFVLYTPDWIPSGDKDIFDLYLPKIMYVRYGIRGEDPFYAKLGSISDFTLGNGLIVSNYSNTRFLPETRLFGLQAGVDGALFGVPYIGAEALTGNLAKFDVVGGRVFLRPLAFLGSSILGKLQIGATAVVDQNPYLYYTNAPGTAELTYVYGVDVTVPVVTGSAFSLNVFTEGAVEKNSAMGAIGGVGGRLLGFLDYGAQIRYLQAGFIPTYFDGNYDIYRAERYDYIEATPAGDFTPSWMALLGFNLFNQKLAFSALLDGPFALVPSPGSSSTDVTAFPHLKGKLALKEGIIGGLSAEAGYEKYFIGRQAPFFEDLIDPTDAVIGFTVNYKTGATVLTLAYTYRWDPTANDFDVSSSLSATVRF